MKVVLVVLILLALALSVCAHGQTKPESEQTCPKYQHNEGIQGVSNCRPVAENSNLMECGLVPPNCVDDLHIVTEAEWQDLMQRLTALEYPWPKLTKREQP
jgi:hypothetical protein